MHSNTNHLAFLVEAFHDNAPQRIALAALWSRDLSVSSFLLMKEEGTAERWGDGDP